MSGGSWNYCFGHLDDAAERLLLERDPYRRTLGRQLKLIATALHDIEWVDSGDYSPGRDDESIKAALGPQWREGVLSELIMEAEEVVSKIDDAIKEARGVGSEVKR